MKMWIQLVSPENLVLGGGKQILRFIAPRNEGDRALVSGCHPVVHAAVCDDDHVGAGEDGVHILLIVNSGERWSDQS